VYQLDSQLLEFAMTIFTNAVADNNIFYAFQAKRWLDNAKERYEQGKPVITPVHIINTMQITPLFNYAQPVPRDLSAAGRAGARARPGTTLACRTCRT
jgi:hypothetical protein